MPTGGSNYQNLEKEVNSAISSKKKVTCPFLLLQKLNKTPVLLSSKQCPFKTDGVKQTSLSKTSWKAAEFSCWSLWEYCYIIVNGCALWEVRLDVHKDSFCLFRLFILSWISFRVLSFYYINILKTGSEFQFSRGLCMATSAEMSNFILQGCGSTRNERLPICKM